MGGETEEHVSGWTVDTLRMYLLTVIEERDRRYLATLDERDRRYSERDDAWQTAMRAALAAAERAVGKAETATEKRFDSVNEFRAALTDMTREQMPRGEADTRFAALSEKIDELKVVQDRGRGHSRGMADGWGYLVGAVGALGGIVALVFALTGR